MITKDSHIETECWRCHTSYLLPRALHTAAKSSEKISFFCPYGHEAHYPAGETVEDKLRRERDLLKQQMAQRDDQLHAQSVEISKLQKVEHEAKRMAKRISAGVCPCCNRQFQNMALHMKQKHPLWDRHFGEKTV